MIFTVVKNEANEANISTQKFRDTIHSLFDSDFKSKKISFDLSESLNKDIAALKEYNKQIILGDSPTEAFGKTMSKAGEEAKELAKSAGTAGVNIDTFRTKQEAGIATTNADTAATWANVAAKKALSIALNVGVMIAVTAAVTLLYKGYDHLVNSQQRAIEKGNELTSTFKEQTDAIKSNLSTLNGLQDEFNKLSQGVDDYGNNISLSTEEYKQYKDIVEKIIGISPQLTAGYDTEGKAIANKNGLIEQSIALLKEENRLKLEGMTSDSSIKDVGKGEIAEYQKLAKDLKKLQTEEFYSLISDLGGMRFGNEEYSFFQQIAEQISGEVFNNMSDFWSYGKILQENTSEVYQAMLEQTDLFTSEDLTKFKTYLDAKVRLSKELDKQEQALNPTLQLLPQTLTVYDSLTDAQKDFVTRYINGFKITAETTDADLSKMRTSILEFTDSIGNSEGVQDAINKLFSLDKSKLSIREFQKQAESQYNQIVDELSKLGTLTDEQALQLKVALGIVIETTDADGNSVLVTKAEQLSDAVADKINGAIDVNTLQDKFTQQELEIVLKADFKFDPQGDLKQQIEDYISQATYSVVPIIDITSKAFEELNKSIDSTQSAYKTLKSAIEEYNKNGYLSLDTTQAIIALGDEYIGMLFDENGQLQLNAESFIQLANAKLDELETTALRNAINNIEALVSEKKATDDATVASQNAAVAKSEEAQETLKLAEAEMLLAAAKEEAMGDGVAEDAINRIITTFNQYRAVIDATRLSLGNYETSLGGVTSATKSATDAQKEYQAAIKSAKSAVDDLLSMTMAMLKQYYSDIKEAIQDSLSSLTEIYNAEREEIQNTYKAKKAAIDKEKKDLQSLNKEKQKAYNQEKKNIQELQKELKSVYDSNKKAIDEETKAYDKRIKQQLELLRLREDERDYNKELQNKQKSVSDIEAQLLAIQFDTSESSNRKRRELLEQLSKAQLELEELQHDRSVDLQEEALNKELELFKDNQDVKIAELTFQYEFENAAYEAKLERLTAEYEKWQEYYDIELERLADKADQLSEYHEAELQRLENEYKASKAKLDKQIKDIDEFTKKEVNIKKEAIDLIENRYDELYKRLHEWAEEYGTYTDSEIQRVWNNAYKVLNAYDNKQIDVRKTIESLIDNMQSFESSILDAVEAMEKLAKASKKVKSQGSSSSAKDSQSSTWDYKQAHTGGIIGETHLQTHSGPLKSDEVPIIAKNKEVVLSTDQSASDIQNAVAYVADALPANDIRALLAAFIADNTSSSVLNSSIPSSNFDISKMSNSMLSRNMGLPFKNNLNKLPVGEIHNHNYQIDNSKTITGYEVDKMRKIADDQDKKLVQQIINQQKYGAGFNYKTRG